MDQNLNFKVADILVEPGSNRLSREDIQIVIEGRLMTLLLYLCERSGETVSREQLIKSVWNGNVVSDSAIYRAVAELRKALKTNFSLTDVVKTVPKKGYLIEQELISNLNSSEPPVRQTSPYILSISIIAAIVTISLFSGIFFTANDTQQKSTNSLRVKTLTSATGKEYTPSISPNGQWVIYTHREKVSSYGRLYLLRISQTNERDSSGQLIESPLQPVGLTDKDEQSHYSRATWSSSGNRVAFQKLTDNGCEILIGDINFKSFRITNQQPIAKCTSQVQSPISWSSDDKSVFYISALSGRMEAVEQQLDTLESKQLMSPENQFAWNNFVTTSPYDTKALILSYIDYRETEFILYDYETGKHQVIHREPALIRSASWGSTPQNILFEQNAQRVLSLNFESGATRYWYEPGIYLWGITRSKNHPIFAIGQMQQAEEGIKVAEIHSKQDVSDTWSLNSSLIDKNPEFANLSNQIAFVSNRSGNDQIWLREPDGRIKRLTQFSGEKWFGRLRWSKDDQEILFARGEVIYVIDVSSGLLEVLVEYPQEESKVPYAPNWSADNKSIFYSVHQKGRNSIWQLTINDDLEKSREISQSDSRNLQQSLDGKYLYFTNIGINGLIQYNISTDEYQQVLPELHPNNWNAWRVSKDGIYYLNLNSNAKGVYFYSFKTNEKRQIFEWEVITGRHFSISHDGNLYARDLFVDSEASIVKLTEQ